MKNFTQKLIFCITVIFSNSAYSGELIITVINKSNNLYSAKLEGLIFIEKYSLRTISKFQHNKAFQRTEVGGFSILIDKSNSEKKVIIPIHVHCNKKENVLVTIQVIKKKAT